MCGFFGFHSFVADRNEKINISKKAIELLDSRGPDSSGIELDDNNNLIFSNVEEILGNSGRIFVRKSGTQSLIRILIEHESNEVLELAEQKIKLIR